jgi:PPOX class probable F420-dependent enzyme
VDIDGAIEFVRANHHAVLATLRRDGSPQLSPVAASVDDAGTVIVSSRERAAKVLNLRRDPRAWLCSFTDQFFGEWAQVEGSVEVVSLPDAMEGLIEYYRSVSGEHPDWDDYRAAMVREQRVLIKISVSRAGPTYSG